MAPLWPIILIHFKWKNNGKINKLINIGNKKSKYFKYYGK